VPIASSIDVLRLGALDSDTWHSVPPCKVVEACPRHPPVSVDERVDADEFAMGVAGAEKHLFGEPSYIWITLMLVQLDNNARDGLGQLGALGRNLSVRHADEPAKFAVAADLIRPRATDAARAGREDTVEDRSVHPLHERHTKDGCRRPLPQPPLNLEEAERDGLDSPGMCLEVIVPEDTCVWGPHFTGHNVLIEVWEGHP
jgi:hypothetical protein